MSTLISAEPETLADLLNQLGNVPANRILMKPAPGTATVADVQRLCDGKSRRMCELVDGVLVEKSMGQWESRLALILGTYLINYLSRNDIGIATAPDGPFRLSFEQVRFPDVAFIPYENIPEGADPATPIPDWIPALAVEILSESNTRGEMDRKVKDYFAAGVELVWIADPRKRTVFVYTSPESPEEFRDGQFLNGGEILPGLEIAIQEWFDRGEQLRTRK